ncbi:MAG: hypothetical protein IJS62_09155 [Bacteroidales bacterium]|nr:hypothetical protein [Bacteroidales bacterium]
MKRLALVLLASVLFPLLSEAAGRKKTAGAEDGFDVYLLIGEANMAGRGFLDPRDKFALDGVFLLNDRGEVVPATQPLNRYSSVRCLLKWQATCLGGAFAEDVHRATGRRILLVVNARGETSARQWLPGAEGIVAKASSDDLFNEGETLPSLYDEAVRRTREALRYGKLKAILWHQGERDAYEQYAPLWAGKVEEIASSLRSDLKCGPVPFIAGETNEAFERSTFINPEIQGLPKMLSRCDYVPAEGCLVNKNQKSFSRQGVTLLGHRYASKVLQMVYGWSPEKADAVCRLGGEQAYAGAPLDNDGMYTLCDFDARCCAVGEANTRFSVVPNPAPDAVNASALVGRIELQGGTWDCISLNPSSPLDFGGGKTEIRFKVLPPADGASLSVKLTPFRSKCCEPVKVEIPLKASGGWQEVVVDLSQYAAYSNYFQKFYLMPDGGERIRRVWYFDDVLIPDDDLSSLSLFRRAAPPLKADKSKSWMSNSIANPGILRPEQTLDGRWWLMVRGGDGRQGHNGYFTQEAEGFNPLGGWQDHDANPTMPAGWWGEEDASTAIDPCGFTVDGTFYYYYKGIAKGGVNSVLVARTTDGKRFEKVLPIWKSDCGVADVGKWNGKYWLYVARRIYFYEHPESSEGAVCCDILEPGGGPDNCDWYSINGGKMLYMDGKWFLFYQAGVCNPDFPGRIHVAWSDDLLHFTKVQNPQPLFTRGPRGAWDQGAVWAPSVFEYGGTLYMYYEGWGVEGAVTNRDRQYFRDGDGGHSQIGIAACSKDDFLKWCGL